MMTRCAGRVAVRMAPAAALLMALISATVGAQSVGTVSILPQVPYVGDLVEARVTIRGVSTTDVRVPEDLPDLDWVLVRSLELVQRADGVEVRLVFQPFYVGTRQLPVLDLGVVRLEGLTVAVNRLRSDTDLEIDGVRDQLLLPGTTLLFAGLVALLVAIPVSLIVFGGWFRRQLVRIIGRYRDAIPYRRTLRRLRALEEEFDELDARSFYIRIVDVLRDYYDRRFAAGLRSATTGEVSRRLEAVGTPPDVIADLTAVFEAGDRVKFAMETTDEQTRRHHLQIARDGCIAAQRAARGGSRVGS